MKRITVEKFLEMVELGATVWPLETSTRIGLQVGRMQFEVSAMLSDWTDAQWYRFYRRYRAGGVRFGYPGDFSVMPQFLGDLLPRTRRVVPGFDMVETSDVCPADVCTPPAVRRKEKVRR